MRRWARAGALVWFGAGLALLMSRGELLGCKRHAGTAGVAPAAPAPAETPAAPPPAEAAPAPQGLLEASALGYFPASKSGGMFLPADLPQVPPPPTAEPQVAPTPPPPPPPPPATEPAPPSPPSP